MQSPSRGSLTVADRRSGIVTVFGFLFFFVVLVAFFYCFSLERTCRDHFEVCTALRARDDFALIDLVLFNVQIVLAFRTEHHKASRAY